MPTMNPAVESGTENTPSGDKQASTLAPSGGARQPGSPSDPVLNLILCRLNGIDRRLDALEESKKAGNGCSNIIVLDKEHDRVIAEIEKIQSSYDSFRFMPDHQRDRLRMLKARRKELRELLGVKA